MRALALALALAAALLSCGCSSPAPEPACQHASAALATPAQLWPCARDAARAWRADAELYAVEGVIGAADNKPIPGDERALDGYTHEWGFTFANVTARVAAQLVVHANGSADAPILFSWNATEAPRPHPQGYHDALPIAYLDTSRVHDAVKANQSSAAIADATTWHAYSLVSVKDKLPAWFVDSGADSRAGYSEVRVDPGAWRAYYVWLGD